MKKAEIIPVLTSEAGLSLTFANWQAAGVKTLSFNLIDLLIKPGFALLNQLSSLRVYYNWPGIVVLNAASITLNSHYLYELRSPFNGQLMTYSLQDLLILITQLQPDKVLLPANSALYVNQFWQDSLIKTQCYQAFDDHYFIDNAAGFYLIKSAKLTFVEILEKIVTPRAYYLLGDFTLTELAHLRHYPQLLIESDKAAHDGVKGHIYYQNQVINILDNHVGERHTVIDNNCQCPTCRHKLTYSYLQHLLQQTPLLAQRFLVQHNVYHQQNYC